MADPMTSVPANRTLGLVVAGDDGHAMMRGLGRSVSPKAFGHMGAGGQIAWADPASGLSFAYLTNGLDRDPVRLGVRSDALSTAAGRCHERIGKPPR
jgi:CubicO group peptidase (beta-lactamase class C family)